MKLQRDHRERSLLVDITPMVDVVFLLIVFFLTTAQFARMTRADVDLPVEQGEGSTKAEEPGIVINIVADGSIVIDDESMTLEGLKRIVQDEITMQYQGQPTKMKLMLRADRNLPARRINEVIGMLQEMGVGIGRFATEVPR